MFGPSRKNHWILVLFVLITALAFLLWIGGLLAVWWFFKAHAIQSDYWLMVESLSTAVTAAAVFSAGFIAYNELAEAAKSRHMDIADRLFDELNAADAVEARRWIFQNLPADPEAGLRTLTPDGQAAVKAVLNSLDRVAFLTQPGWIPEDLVMPWMHPMIYKAWEKLEPYVLYERERRNEPYYYRQVGELGQRCLAWRAKHLPDTPVRWVKNAL